MIDRHGWAVRNVASSDPAECFSYTVGLTAHGHPEVVMTGLPPDAGTAFLNIAGEIVVREGGRVEAGTSTAEFAEGPPMPVILAEDVSGLTAVRDLYGSVEAVQVIWSDTHGRFPWESGYGNPPGSQPLLGEHDSEKAE